MRYLLFCCSCLLLLSACTTPDNPAGTAGEKGRAQAIVDSAIAAHGGQRFENLKIAFEFRGRHYTASRQGGLYTYTRSFSDSTGQVDDKLNNKGFVRQVNGRRVKLPAERTQAFSQSVNSVIYFAFLPFGLNDPAVRKEYLGEVTIRQQPYHKIKVTFDPEGGGVDYEDTFVYWFGKKNYQLDYLAYNYHTDGGGIRFRVAYGPRVIAGLRFQQYINHEPVDRQADVVQLDSLYEAGQLRELSRIELEHIRPLE